MNGWNIPKSMTSVAHGGAIALLTFLLCPAPALAQPAQSQQFGLPNISSTNPFSAQPSGNSMAQQLPNIQPPNPQAPSIQTAPLSQAPTPQTEVICAGDRPPSGTVITATGTSSICSGSCRARQIQPPQGDVMVICAHQPIPDGYILDSVTTTPDCACAGDKDNAYMIRFDENGRGQEGFLFGQVSAGTQSPWQPGTQNQPFRVGH